MFKQKDLVFKHQPIVPTLGQSADKGPCASKAIAFHRRQGRVFCLMSLLLTTFLRVKINMKARGASQIFAPRLILMFVRVYSGFQVHSELALTGRKWAGRRAAKSSGGPGASSFGTVFRAFKWCPGGSSPRFSSSPPIVSPGIEGEETALPRKCFQFTSHFAPSSASTSLWERTVIPVTQIWGTGTEMKSLTQGHMTGALKFSISKHMNVKIHFFCGA